MSRKEGIFSATPHFPHFELLHMQRAGRIFRPLKPPGRMLRYKALGGPHPAPHNCAFPATSGSINQQPVVAGCTRKKNAFSIPFFANFPMFGQHGVAALLASVSVSGNTGGEVGESSEPSFSEKEWLAASDCPYFIDSKS